MYGQKHNESTKEKMEYARALMVESPEDGNHAINNKIREKFGEGLKSQLLRVARSTANGIPPDTEPPKETPKVLYAKELMLAAPGITNNAILKEIRAKFGSGVDPAEFAAIRFEIRASRPPRGKERLAVSPPPPVTINAEHPLHVLKQVFVRGQLEANPRISLNEIQRLVREKFGSGCHNTLVATVRRNLGIPDARAARHMPAISITPAEGRWANERDVSRKALAMVIDEPKEGTLEKSARKLLTEMKAQGVEELTINVDGTVRAVRVARETFKI